MIFLENLFAKRFSNFPKNFGSWEKLPQSLAPPCRAHNGSYQILFVKSQRFKVFCQAFCKKLAAGGFRAPRQIPILRKRGKP